MYEPAKKFLVGFYSSILLVIAFSFIGAKTLPYYVLFLGLLPLLAYRIFRKNPTQDFASPPQVQEPQLNTPNFSKTNYRKLALAIILGLLSLMVATYYIFELINAPLEKSIRIWQRTVFVFCLCGAGIYYLYNSDKFKTLADKITFFTGVALGPPTAIGFLE